MSRRVMKSEPMQAIALQNRALGAFLGLAVGDALGATVEFQTPEEIAAKYHIHNQIIGGGWLELPPGHITDDTEMALALSSALVQSGGWNLTAIANSFVHWMRYNPTDIGSTCRRGLCRYISDGSLNHPPSKQDGGNGAAMRHLPVVLATLLDEKLMIQRCIEQAHITHNNVESDMGTVTLARMTRQLLLQGAAAPCDQIAAELAALNSKFKFKPWPGRTSGYIVDTMQTVLDGFFNTGSFEDCLVRVVNRGGDADTNGALAGQLAGALYGVQGIPRRWLKQLDLAVADQIRCHTLLLLQMSGIDSIAYVSTQASIP